MRLSKLKKGEIYTRTCHWGQDKDLNIRYVGGELRYCRGNTVRGRVTMGSSAHTYSDFVRCVVDDYGTVHVGVKALKMQAEKNKGVNMKYVNNIVVSVNDGGAHVYAKDFENEDEALKFIAGALENNPSTKFKMFKAYQVVEPKIRDLSDLIQKIVY